MDTNTNINKKSKLKRILLYVFLPLSFVAVFVFGYFAYYFLNSGSTTLSGAVLNIINNRAYLIDPLTGEQRYLTEEEIADLIVDSYLDKYSEYYNKEEYEKVQKELAGNELGVGLSFYRNAPIVFKVIGNSPAEKAGMLAEDRVLYFYVGENKIDAVNGEQILKDLGDIKKGESVTFYVERGGETISFSVAKEDYVVSYVTYQDSQVTYRFRSEKAGEKPVGQTIENAGNSELDSKTAYIKLSLFEGDCVEQMRSALQFMKDRGRENLVLDLRDNGGGSLSKLIGIASMLIYNNGEQNSVVAISKKRNGEEVFATTKNEYFSNLKKISVIANVNSASATECLIGAMLHYEDGFNKDRLVIEEHPTEGARTYGKGIMQTTYWMIKGGAIKLTTGKMFWPDRQTSIHQVGITTTEKNSVPSSKALARAIECINE